MAGDPFAEAMTSMDNLLFQSWYPILFVLLFSVFYWIRSMMRGGQVRVWQKLDGKTALITGGNGAIAKQMALFLVWRGARVILACRDKVKAKEVVDEVRQKTGTENVTSMELDLTSFKSINKFADDFLKTEEKLDILINNAGIILHPTAPKTEDGFELHFQTNYLGHFLLTHRLLDLLKKSKPSRIVNIAAVAYALGEINLDDVNFDKNPDYAETHAYSQSKLAVMMFTKALSTKLEGTGVTAYSVHPGVVMTEAHRHLGYYSNGFVRYSLYPIVWFMTKSAADGAQTALYCAQDATLETESGKYYVDCGEAKTDNDLLNDDKLLMDLYERSLQWCKL